MDHAASRNLIMDLGGPAERMKFMIRDRGPDFTAASDAVLADAGIRTVLCNVQTPRMNAIAGRWIGGCRRELPDRALAWNQHHLRRILRDYEIRHNQHRPHRSLHGAASGNRPASSARSANTAWSHDVDEVLGTRKWCSERSRGATR